MTPLRLRLPAHKLRDELARRGGRVPPMPRVKVQVLDYQLQALFLLASQYNRPGARFLEIGTGHGGSGHVLSRAAPLAEITSLTTSPAERDIATALWKAQNCRNVRALVAPSWDYISTPEASGPFDLVFVDGDHNRIVRDLPWFDRLREGGLLLCHDYSPQDSVSPSRIVYDELNRMARGLCRSFDVEIVDEGNVGMAGFYRRAGERFPGLAPGSVGIVLRGEDACARDEAARCGAEVVVSDGWDLPWPRTLFAAPGVCVPWDLLGAGFELLARWDVAAPFAPGSELAADVGPAEERRRTEASILDLRVPLYAHELLFVQDSAAGRAWLEAWREEAAGASDERLAFLRALGRVKPRFCVLPRVWLAGAAQRARMAPPPPVARPRARSSAPPPGRSQPAPIRAPRRRGRLGRRSR